MKGGKGLLWTAAVGGALAAAMAAGEGGQGEPEDRLARLEELLEEPADEAGGFEYRADRFTDYVEGDSIRLEGHAAVLHRGARLEAAQMVYLRDLRVVVARSALDSAGRPSGRPTLRRGEDILEGERIVYNTDTGEGLIADGRIGHDDGFYRGQQIRTRSEAEFLVRSGSYTTCDYEQPHFDFYSPRIKVLVGDMAVARPVYFRVAGHRLFWVPFYVFSLRQDRQSGVLTPGFGRRPVTFGSRLAEWEVRDLGYYLAPSDHWDLTLAADLRQRSGWLARSALAYARRYQYDGHLETRLQSYQSGARTSWSWWLSGNHRHELGPDAGLRASGTFQSDRDFLRDNGTGLGDRLNRTLRSNLRYDRRWREAGWSVSAGASQTKNLDTERADAVLPEVSLRSDRKALRSPPAGTAAGGGPWYTRVFYDTSARVRRARSTSAPDATGADAGLRLSSQQRPAPWVNVNTGLNTSWTDADLGDGDREGVRTDQVSASTTLSQTVYGLFYPRVWRLTALRHVLKPDAGLTFNAARADTGGIAGLGGRGGDWRASRRVTLRLANSFWAKLLRGDSDSEEEKLRLAQLNLSSSYDFDARRGRSGRRRALSDLVTSLAIDPGRHLQTRLDLRSDLYDGQDRLGPPRLRQIQVSTTLRMASSSRRDSSRDEAETAPGRRGSWRDEAEGGATAALDEGRGDYGYESGLQQDISRSGGRRLTLSHYDSRQRTAGGRTSRRSWLRGSVGGALWRVWHVDYSVSLNLHDPRAALLDRDRITAELLSVQREFHDWTATLNVVPSRFVDDRAFYLKVQLKDIPQIRFERGDQRRIG